MSIRKNLLNILFWSVISAAFIGPGTITTAASSGAEYGFSLIWALVFSTLACLVLQEAAARTTLLSGKTLGEMIALQFSGSAAGPVILWTIGGSILLGSAAFEAGNILGAVAGIKMLFHFPDWGFVLLISLVAALALLLPSLQSLARFMGILVAIMGVAFLSTAILLKPDFPSLLKGSLLPSIPDDPRSGLLILGLVGTTVVPYNLFLGSGISSSAHTLREMRTGLSIAVLMGGLISIAVLVVGSSLKEAFAFETLKDSLSENLGPWAGILFSLGLFAAGFSSAITAALAPVITFSGLFGNQRPGYRRPGSFSYKLIWGIVLLTGFSFGISGLKPVPVILAAQALNGLILPFISLFLVFAVNHPSLPHHPGRSIWFSNTLLAVVVWLSLVLGCTQFLKVVLPPVVWSGNAGKFLIGGMMLFSFVISALVWRNIFLRKKSGSTEKNEKPDV